MYLEMSVERILCSFNAICDTRGVKIITLVTAEERRKVENMTESSDLEGNRERKREREKEYSRKEYVPIV
jgi:hypothetical protein